MKKSRWSDDEIKKLLHQMPEISDKRNQVEIYQSLFSLKLFKRKRSWIPAVTAAFSLVIILLLSVSFFYERNHLSSQIYMKQANSTRADKQIDRSNLAADDSVNQKTASEKMVSGKLQGAGGENPAGKSEAAMLSKNRVITIGVPDRQFNLIIPVSLEVKQFPESKRLDVLKKNMDGLKGKVLGLGDYYPLQLTFAKNPGESSINIDIPAKSRAIRDDQLFLRTIRQTMKYQHVVKFTLSENGKAGASFPETGWIREEKLQASSRQSYLIYQADTKSPSYIVPYMEYSYIGDALASAKKNPGIEGVKPSIPRALKWTKILENKKEKKVTIFLSSDSELKDTKAGSQTVEAILFTAKDFGYEWVNFKNPPLAKIGNFQLNRAIRVPQAPNVISSIKNQ
ncbi:hypothetical protein [Bacillus sp. MUM 13]|uniref:hypothetical protein n=1 Tax=Bacillus sp. MUM 13 TaxID=1678001 RepID=UPI0008F5C731|nr:hypothetical protein [Bacillus sp. MUM 13]OIK13601.1 hypothetical protein BIV59_05130 [Bacillus sp. MUM 13]